MFFFLSRSLKNFFTLFLFFFVLLYFVSSPASARILVKDGVKVPLVAADSVDELEMRGRVLFSTEDSLGSDGDQEPPSALEIIRSRSLWQEEVGLEEDQSSLSEPEGFENLLETDQELLNPDGLESAEVGSFTNPAPSSDLDLTEGGILGVTGLSLDQFTSGPVSFLETLEVLGASSLAATSVSGPLSQDGTLMITEGRNIDVVGDDLHLQSEGLGGIDFVAGKMKLDREGNLVVSGQLSVAGGIQTDFLSPLASDTLTVGQNLVVEGVATVGDLHSRGELKGRSLSVAEETNLAGPVTIQGSPLTVEGSLSVSDYARVGDLIIDRGLKILDQGQSGSVGTATIYAGTHQAMIANTRVAEASKVFLTADFDPLGETGFHQGFNLYESPPLFVSEKVPGSHFVVATDRLLEEDLTFNWLMVN